MSTKEDVKKEIGDMCKGMVNMEGRLKEEIGEVKSWVKSGVIIGVTFLAALVAILGLERLG